ncbi:MAG TPA: helix-turn-helix transcriptional regulator [Solirubrobacterales bacterium]|jgi:transcriptional regulator with XRE-family HTH domain|nr:helix-turn-helix transcriptional regulator [Solirubrobacterales bacterium]
MDFASRFGENLARCRKRAGLSQEQLGLRASLHRTEIGLLERGERVPRIDTLVKIAGALQLPTSKLVDGIRWAPAETSGGEFSFVFPEE